MQEIEKNFKLEFIAQAHRRGGSMTLPYNGISKQSEKLKFETAVPG